MLSFNRAHVATGLVLATLAALGPGPSMAQETIAPDRPGIGSGTFVLGPGTVQLETGVSFATDAFTRSLSIGEVLVRIGGPGVEFEIFANSFVVQSDRGPGTAADAEGLLDLAAGVKVPVARNVNDRFNLSLQGILTMPTGADAFTGDDWVPTFVALADLALDDNLGVAVNVGRQITPGTASDVTTLIVTPGVSLGEGVGAYAGWAGAFSGGSSSHIAEGGLTFLVNDDTQLDVNTGFDVEQENWFLGVGFATRWGVN